MKWNIFPYYKIPIDYFSETGGSYHAGWIITNDIDMLRDDQDRNKELLLR